MKRILILTAGPGEGKRIAAENLRRTFENLVSCDAQVEVIDLISDSTAEIGQRLRHPFQAGAMALRETLGHLLRGSEPDLVISTHSAYGAIISEIYREGRKRDFVLISVVCEAAVSETAWAQTPGDFFIVADESASRCLLAKGIAPKRIKALGFPVLGPIARPKRLPPSATTRPKILCLLNSAKRKAPKLLTRLLEHEDWDCTVVTDDPELQQMAREKSSRFTVIHDLAKITALLPTHHVVISRAETGIMREAMVVGCPLIVNRVYSSEEQENVDLLRRANAGALGEKPREIVDWIERSLRDNGRLLALWDRNLLPLGQPHAAEKIVRFVVDQSASPPIPRLHERVLPDPFYPTKTKSLPRAEKKLLMCDLHTHSTWSDGKLTIAELVDFYGERGFDCLCVTDHLCDPQQLLGKIVNLTGLVIPPGKIAAYFAAVEREKKRAWDQYKLLLMTGIEFNKDGYTSKTSAHLLGIDLKAPIDPSLDLQALIAEIHAQGALAIASHPHEIKSEWGKNTLYLWEHLEDFAPLLDAWEIANRDDIFNPVGLRKLPFIASSDFHKPKHIYSWKTLLYCEKNPEAIKQCIRVNRDVSLTLYRDHRFGLDDRAEVKSAALVTAQG